MGWVTFSSRIKKYINWVIDFELKLKIQRKILGRFCFEVVVVLGTT